MSASRQVLPYSALVTASVVWGGSVIAQKLALGSFSPIEVSIIRGLGALGILIPLWWWQEKSQPGWTVRDFGIFTMLGLTVLGNHLCVLYGLRFIGAGSAGVIIGASPAITALLSSLILKDVAIRSIWLGCTLSFLGVGLVSGMSIQEESGSHSVLGGTLIAMSLISWALFTIGSRRVMERFSPLTVNWTTLLASILLQLPILATDHKMLDTGMSTVSTSGWMALVYVIVFATALGQQAWLYGVSRIGPARASIFVNLIPVSALLLSGLILGESIGIWDIAGISLILAGVWLVNRPSTR